MDELKVIGLAEVIKITGLPRDRAYNLLREKDCPTLPRKKGAAYLIRQGAFIEWYTRKY